jgi:allantoate deiminase
MRSEEMADSRFSVDPEEVERHIMQLAQYGAYGETGVWRTVYSPEWVAAQQQVQEWCRGIGLEVWQDAVGNVWGRMPGAEGGKPIVTGSHIDSQTPGGRYDGALGVISAYLALKTLKERFGQPKRTLELLSFCEEESSRFAATNFWGSRAIVGLIAPDEPNTLRGYDGVLMADAMRAIGLDPDRIADAKHDDIGAFVELHVEQGPILEEAGLPVAVVNAITGIRHWVITLHGRSDHAGARPIDDRIDPMAGAAEIVSRFIKTALEMGRPAVTTVGRIQAEPGFPAIVPDSVTFTLDARHPDPEARERLYEAHMETLREVCERRGLRYETRITTDHPPCMADPTLVRTFEEAAEAQGIPYQTMASGAAHDTQRMVHIAPVVMLFVQSKGGRSHTPAEYSTPEDAAKGVELLAAGLHRLAY